MAPIRWSRTAGFAAMVLVAALLVVGPLDVPARAHDSNQKASLSGRAVVGSGDEDGSGRVRLKSSSEIDTICFKISVSNVKSLTGAHIHQAVKGQGGDIVVKLFEGSKARRSPVEGCNHKVDPALIESIQSSPGSYYVDVHNKQFPDGALRGQLKNVAESGSFEPCKTYKPEGAEERNAGTAIVTDANHDSHPLRIQVNAPEGAAGSEARVFQNVQLTTQGSTQGLYASYEFPIEEDYDIFVRMADGQEVARADGMNPTAVGPATEPNGAGGHSEQGAEYIDGLTSNHCDGYTLELITKSGAGGTLVLTLWVGEPQYEP